MRALRSIVPSIHVFTDLTFSASDNLLVATDRASRIHAWDATNWTELGGTQGYNRLFAVSPNGQTIAYLEREEPENSDAGEENLLLHLWNPWTSHDESIFSYKEEMDIHAIAFDPDGAVLGVMGWTKVTHTPEAWLWDVSTQQILPIGAQASYPRLMATLELESMGWQRTQLEGVPGTYQPWAYGELKAPVFSPDGTLIVSLCEERVCLLDAESGEQVQVLETIEGEITSAAFSPDGQLLAATTGGYWYVTRGRLYVWETATGKLLAAPEGHVGAAWGVVFSADGTVIASAGGGCYECEGWGSDNVVRLWRVAP